MSTQNNKTLPDPERKVEYRRINLARALRLQSMGLNPSEIARQLGVSHQAVRQQLARLESVLLNKEEAKQFDDYIPGLLKGVMLEFIRSAVEPAKLKKSSSRDLMVSAGIAASKLAELGASDRSKAFRGFMVKAQKDGLELTIQSLSGPMPGVEEKEEPEPIEEEPEPKDPHGVS